jgi:hypothetical protein
MCRALKEMYASCAMDAFVFEFFFESLAALSGYSFGSGRFERLCGGAFGS